MGSLSFEALPSYLKAPAMSRNSHQQEKTSSFLQLTQTVARLPHNGRYKLLGAFRLYTFVRTRLRGYADRQICFHFPHSAKNELYFPIPGGFVDIMFVQLKKGRKLYLLLIKFSIASTAMISMENPYRP